MKQNQIIEKLKEGYYIEWEELNYTRRIFIYRPDGSDWLDQINIKSFQSLYKKGILKIESYDDKDLSLSIHNVQRKKIKYVWNEQQNH